MGMLAARFAERPETRGIDNTDFLTNDNDMLYGPQTGAGVRVNVTNAMRLSAVWGCVRLLVNAVATLPVDIIVKVGPNRFPEFQKPSWLINPNPADPTMTKTEYFAQITASLLLDGNFFVHCPNTVFDPSILIVLNPALVEVKTVRGVPEYTVRDQTGRIVLTCGPLNMLHGTWIKMPAANRGLSPIDAARQGIGTGLATEDFAGRFFGHGSALSFGVEVPGVLTDVQKTQFRQDMKDNYAGTKNSHSVGVLTGGAKFITGLGITNEQAQFLQTREFTVEDISSRIFGIPAYMMGIQRSGASSYASVEQRALDFKQFAVMPLLVRIEDPHQRIVQVPEAFASTRATAQFMFNQDGLARADLKTRYDSYLAGITGSVLAPNEARALEDLPPIPGGDSVYRQMQYVPLDTPIAKAPPPVVPEPTISSARELRELNEGLIAEIRAMRPQEPTNVTVHVPDVVVPAPVLNVMVPEQPVQPAPIVNVNVPAPIVNVSVPEQAAPVVNVAAPIVNVSVPEQPAPVVNVAPSAPPVLMPRVRRRVERDGKGLVTALVED